MLLSLWHNVLCSFLAQEGTTCLLSATVSQALHRAEFNQARSCISSAWPSIQHIDSQCHCCNDLVYLFHLILTAMEDSPPFTSEKQAPMGWLERVQCYMMDRPWRKVDLNLDWSDPRAVPWAALGGRKEGRKGRDSQKFLRGLPAFSSPVLSQFWCECHPNNTAILSAGGKI